MVLRKWFLFQDKINAIKELNFRLTELETEHTYQVKQMEAHHEEQISSMQTNYLAVIDELKETNEVNICRRENVFSWQDEI